MNFSVSLLACSGNVTRAVRVSDGSDSDDTISWCGRQSPLARLGQTIVGRVVVPRWLSTLNFSILLMS